MKRQIGIGALAGLAMAALLLAGCDTASNSGANGDEGGTQVPPQVNAALDGLGYVVEGQLNTPIWEFEGGKAAYKGSDFLYPYTVSEGGKTLTINGADNTVYTYTISADKEELSAGKKKVGGVESDEADLTRNLAGRTYKNLTGTGSDIILNIKTAWAFDVKKGATLWDEGKKYEINEERIIRFPYGPLGWAEYTVSDNKQTLTPTEECDSGFQHVLTLVTVPVAE